MPQALPFTRAQFLEAFAFYNTGIWPAQLLATALSVTVVLMLLLRTGGMGRSAFALLALLWAWTGSIYHILYFAAINRAAIVFGAAFLVQGGLFVLLAITSQVVLSRSAANGLVGWTMIAYALILYPMLVLFSGHAYPAAPLFVITPCPLVIFTLGLLVLSESRAPWLFFVIPSLWSIVGGSAAVLLGMYPDYALPVAAVAAFAANAGKPKEIR